MYKGFLLLRQSTSMRMMFVWLVLTAYFTSGFSAHSVECYDDRIESYRSILSLTEADLRKIFGNSNVAIDRIIAHDPGSYEKGLSLFTEGSKIFLKMEDNFVKSILFSSPVFKTSQGVSVGQDFCEISPLYPKAEFYMNYVGELYLMEKEQGLDFEFLINDDLPLSKYREEGLPNRNSLDLCKSILDQIELTEERGRLGRGTKPNELHYNAHYNGHPKILLINMDVY